MLDMSDPFMDQEFMAEDSVGMSSLIPTLATV
jgi:hypothetical protein